jgi:hypothetical protein
MLDIINLAVPYFGLIFIGFACGKTKALPESGLSWMNFFLLYVALPALLFVIMSKTPFEELNNPPFLIATTLGTMTAFVVALLVGRLAGGLSLREATLAGLSGAYGNIGYMGPGLALAVVGSKAAAPTPLIFCYDSIFLFSAVPLLIELTRSSLAAACLRRGAAADRVQSADHVRRRRRSGGCAPSSFADRARQHAGLPAERRGPDGTLRARRDGRTAAIQADPVGSAGRDRGQAFDPPACSPWPDAAVRTIRATVGRDRRPDGVATTGAERIRHRAAK